MSPLVIAVVGVSGAGKTHLITAACRDDHRLTRIPSVTTRQPRDGETPGVDKVFVSPDEFARRSAAGELICVATNFGAMYGHDRVAIESSQVPVVELAAISVASLREVFSRTRVVVIEPQNPAMARDAVTGRAPDGTSVQGRIVDSSGGILGLEADAVVLNAFDRASSEGFASALSRLLADD